MRYAVFGLYALLLTTTPAHAYSCADVRSWVAQYGVTRAIIVAKLYGVTAAQIQQARACLRSPK